MTTAQDKHRVEAMNLKFILIIRIGGRTIWLPLPILLPIVLLLEILAIFPLIFIAIWRKEAFFWRIASGFYISRLLLVFMLYGGQFKIGIRADDRTLQIC